jgi:hypothetical protein
MPKRRKLQDIDIHRGVHRAFEWYWAENGIMPGLDAFEKLSLSEQEDFIASLTHWGMIAPGNRPLQTRVNDENDAPKIVGVKARKHRFTAFREDSGTTWIAAFHYLKEGKKRDKTGDRAVAAAVKARRDYIDRVREGTYYERG